MLTRVICGIAAFVALVAITLAWIEHDGRMKLQRKVDDQQTTLLLVTRAMKAQQDLVLQTANSVLTLQKARLKQMQLQRGLANNG